MAKLSLPGAESWFMP